MEQTAKKLVTPLGDEQVNALRAGDRVAISGVIYTARDAAHKRMAEALDRGEALPIPVDGQVIYYVGPTPTPPGRVIGSAGPTTSGRMDAYTPRLLALGLRGTIGKGWRSPEVVRAMQQHRAVYFAAVGGAGALIAASIVECETVAYEDLGPEAIRRLVVRDLPAVVAIDALGGNVYQR